MAEKESGAASAATETTPMTKTTNRNGLDQTDTVSQKTEVVKSDWSRASQLQWLLSHCNRRELVEEIQKIYPKFDKTVLSKAKNAESYGVELCDDALKHLWLTYAPEEYAKRKRHSDGHRNRFRISCRMDAATYTELFWCTKQDGYKTMQDWIMDQIQKYIKEEIKTNVNQSSI